MIDTSKTRQDIISGEVVCCQKNESTVPRIKDYFYLYRCYKLILMSLCRQGNSITCLIAGHFSPEGASTIPYASFRVKFACAALISGALTTVP